MSSRYKIFSFFSGSGFLDLGFEKNGFDIEFVNEFSTSFINAYKYSREMMKLRKPNYGYNNTDINVYLADQVELLRGYISEEKKQGNIVGFIGGPPCPDFSVAGKNKGRNGDNGKLSLSYISVISEFKPDFFLFENVKGLWRTARHREFYEELKEILKKSGYVMTERLTNALEYGVPQDRDRILLFGIKRTLIDSDNIDDFPWDKYHKYSIEQVKAIKWPTRNPFIKDSVTECPNGIPKELTVQYWFNKNKVENHMNKDDFFIPRQGLIRMQTVEEGDDSKKSYKRLHRWRYSPTAAYGNNEVHLHPYKERRISVAEALAIQSLPKDFCLPKEMTLTDKFKTVGNGVPYVMSSGVAKTIYDYLEENLNE
ncbi:DNA cytosine methyltransferase [Butyrivibrio sp. WCD2001]|uniref:DNA cytosine methyltransferase n=1 Tax=Butyrivibrio sp. WCD2001 TaxID=1280681 RepID=UPI0004148D1C|nr:DNA cytosine methyltransferase [Butyrivibrio sp. WCD2001]